MKTGTKSHAAIQQTVHNTNNWVGHKNNSHISFETGQTFISPGDGSLESIEILLSVVTKPGKMVMTFHLFDQKEKTIGPAPGSSSLDIDNGKNGKWLAFRISGLQLHKNKTYRFRLKSTDTFIGLGEPAGSHLRPPFSGGEEWLFTGAKAKGSALPTSAWYLKWE